MKSACRKYKEMEYSHRKLRHLISCHRMKVPKTTSCLAVGGVQTRDYPVQHGGIMHAQPTELSRSFLSPSYVKVRRWSEYATSNGFPKHLEEKEIHKSPPRCITCMKKPSRMLDIPSMLLNMILLLRLDFCLLRERQQMPSCVEI